MFLDEKPNVAVALELADSQGSRNWLAPGVGSARVSSVRGARDGFARAQVDESKLPDSLRLRALKVDLYADDRRVCDGTLGVARLGSLITADHGDFEVSEITDFETLFFEVDPAPACAVQLRDKDVHVAWARDASLPKPVIVGKAERATNPDVRRDVRDALNAVRGTSAFRGSQDVLNFNNAKMGEPILPLERRYESVDGAWNGAPHWTRYTWKGEERGYFALVEDCPPPEAHVGFDFRVNGSGALEAVPGIDRNFAGSLEIADPSVLADIDADGGLEAIEARSKSYRLVPFDPPAPATPSYALLVVDNCR